MDSTKGKHLWLLFFAYLIYPFSISLLLLLFFPTIFIFTYYLCVNIDFIVILLSDILKNDSCYFSPTCVLTLPYVSHIPYSEGVFQGQGRSGQCGGKERRQFQMMFTWNIFHLKTMDFIQLYMYRLKWSERTEPWP